MSESKKRTLNQMSGELDQFTEELQQQRNQKLQEYQCQELEQEFQECDHCTIITNTKCICGLRICRYCIEIRKHWLMAQFANIGKYRELFEKDIQDGIVNFCFTCAHLTVINYFAI